MSAANERKHSANANEREQLDALLLELYHKGVTVGATSSIQVRDQFSEQATGLMERIHELFTYCSAGLYTSEKRK